MIWGTLVIADSVIEGNFAYGGAGILNLGTMTITNSVIRGNIATTGYGGGIFNGGGETSSLIVDTSTVISNSAAYRGGGIFNGISTTTVMRSTVSANTAGPGWFGGGIANDGGLVVVESSTVSGNVGGGIGTRQYSATALDNSTVSANAGGGSYNSFGLLLLKNTILAGNSRGADLIHSDWPGVGEPGRTESYGFNVIGSTNGMILFEASDQLNVSDATLRLGRLRDNGGPTFTHAPLWGSPAINAGDSTDAPVTDQRGFAPMMGANPDIGAYESGNQPGAVLNADGCSIEDLCPCEGPWKNHGEYVTSIIAHAWEFYRAGLINLSEGQTLVHDAARSVCGK